MGVINYDKETDKLINEFYKKDSDFINHDMLTIIENAQNCLKKIYTLSGRSEIREAKYGKNYEQALLWQSEFVHNFYFFATMLGYTDARICYYQERVNYYTDLLGKVADHNIDIVKQNLAINRSLMEETILVREKIISDYHELGIFKEPFGTLVEDVLTTCPCHLKFSKLYKDCMERPFSMNLHQHLITAYNIGYIAFDDTANVIVNNYRELVTDLREHKEKNMAEVEAVKAKCKKKFFNYASNWID